MAHHPAYTLGALSVAGGLMGFAKAKSVPSLVAGVGSGAILIGSGYMIQNGMDYGFELAFGASGALAAFGAVRAYKTRKVPMVVLAAASGATALYYARWLRAYSGVRSGE